MSMYAASAYSVCMAGVRCVINDEETVEEMLVDNIKEKGVAKIIMGYYDMFDEHEYFHGRKTDNPPEEKKQGENERKKNKNEN